jgi:phosphoribosylaminoimidazole carboxylase PurE protein
MIVPILLGSQSDKDFAKTIEGYLTEWGIKHETIVASAHKVPEKVLEIVQKFNKLSEPVCYLTIAGRSNGLSGVVAANSVHPVVACPPFKDKDDMSININSTLMMPSDTPVLTVVDPQNAAMAVVRILANCDSDLKAKVEKHIQSVKASF